MRVQVAARRRPAGDRFLGPGRLHGPAQRAPAHLGPWLRGCDRHRRRRGFGAADDRYLSAGAAIGGGDPVGGLARRGDGGRASGQHRSAQRPGAHGASPARAGAAPAARGARLAKRLRLPAQPVSPGRCAGAHRDPREPHPAPAARAWPRDLPGGSRRVPRSRRPAHPRRIPQRLSRPEQRARALRIAPARRPGGLDLLIQVSAARQSVG